MIETERRIATAQNTFNKMSPILKDRIRMVTTPIYIYECWAICKIKDRSSGNPAHSNNS